MVGLRVRSILFGGLALLAAGALVLFAPEPSQSETAQDPPQATSEEMAAAMAAVAETLQQLDEGEIEEEAERVADERGLFPSAGTCGMRRSSVMPSASRKDRLLFAAAALATDPAVKQAILEDLAGRDEPALRARAYLGLAHLAMRVGDPERATAYAQAMLAEPSLPETCRSDGYFVLAAAAAAPDAAEAALVSAVAHDPGSWNAQLALTRHLAVALETPASAGACADRARHLVRSVVALDSLAESDEQLSWIEAQIARDSGGAITPGRALVLGMVRERSARVPAAIDVDARGARSASTDVCGEILQNALRQRLDRLRPENQEESHDPI